MKKILIISTEYTGRGHKSIADSLSEQLDKRDDVEYKIIEGFSLNIIGNPIAKSYSLITHYISKLWGFIWRVTSKQTKALNRLIARLMKAKFIELLDEFNPDAIVSVHPCFNGSVAHRIKKYNKNIPLFTIIADPVSISKLWIEKTAHTICLTDEAQETAVRFGVPPALAPRFGWPVGEKFVNTIFDNDGDVKKDDGLTFTVMSGSEGSNNLKKIMCILSDNFQCNIKVVCGNNDKLKKKLEKEASKFDGKIEVLGFVTNVHKLMIESDIVLLRASPNTFMEAIMCNVPIIITGAFPGQEEKNPDWIRDNNLGAICNDLEDLQFIVEDLLSSETKYIKEIKKAQQSFRSPTAAKDIVEYIINNSN